jgi:hypothetical protein
MGCPTIPFDWQYSLKAISDLKQRASQHDSHSHCGLFAWIQTSLQMLLLNDHISSLAVKHLYQDLQDAPYKGTARLIKTLTFSIRGLTSFPYHTYVAGINLMFWIRQSKKTPLSQLQQVLGGILECKKVRALSLSVPGDVVFFCGL